jgi:anti-anti-sigma regulatory factor
MSARPDLVLDPGCTLRDSTELQFLLLTTDCSRREVVIDGSKVERIDTAGLQLLVAFAQLQKSAGRVLRWCGSSDVLILGSRTLGLDAVLGLPESNSQGAA